jgi:hypothetical protein
MRIERYDISRCHEISQTAIAEDPIAIAADHPSADGCAAALRGRANLFQNCDSTDDTETAGSGFALTLAVATSHLVFCHPEPSGEGSSSSR